jgi:WD40 repeat protein
MQWSPNSQYLAYGNPGHLCAYNLVSGQMRVDADLGLWYKAAPDAPLSAWSADSHLFAFPQPDEHNPWLDIQVREIENGSIRYSCSTRHDLAALTWSPNGNYLAAAYVDQGTNIIQWYNAADGSLLNSATYPAQVEHLLWSPHSAYLVAAASLHDVLTLRVYTMRELFTR